MRLTSLDEQLRQVLHVIPAVSGKETKHMYLSPGCFDAQKTL
jgi:hypothetical protein